VTGRPAILPPPRKAGSDSKLRGAPKFIRSDNGPEFIADAIRRWLREAGVQALYIAPGSPWENAYCESFTNRFRDELLDRDWHIKRGQVTGSAGGARRVGAVLTEGACAELVAREKIRSAAGQASRR